MRKIVLCVLCLLLLASCGRQPAIVSGDTDEEEMFTLDLSGEIETAAQPQAKETTCKLLEKDGARIGFEMRFRRTDAIDTLMASPDNFYFAVVQCGKTKTIVPTEEIRVLVDVPTDSFVLTLLVPKETKYPQNSATVSFYISSREEGASKALFAAQETVDIS